MKVKIYADEWYPVYTMYEDDGSWDGEEVEISEAEYKHMQSVFNQFSEVQRRLAEMGIKDNRFNNKWDDMF